MTVRELNVGSIVDLPSCHHVLAVDHFPLMKCPIMDDWGRCSGDDMMDMFQVPARCLRMLLADVAMVYRDRHTFWCVHMELVAERRLLVDSISSATGYVHVYGSGTTGTSLYIAHRLWMRL